MIELTLFVTSKTRDSAVLAAFLQDEGCTVTIVQYLEDLLPQILQNKAKIVLIQEKKDGSNQDTPSIVGQLVQKGTTIPIVILGNYVDRKPYESYPGLIYASLYPGDFPKLIEKVRLAVANSN